MRGHLYVRPVRRYKIVGRAGGGGGSVTITNKRGYGLHNIILQKNWRWGSRGAVAPQVQQACMYRGPYDERIPVVRGPSDVPTQLRRSFSDDWEHCPTFPLNL